jgi:outer membrane protein TolC
LAKDNLTIAKQNCRFAVEQAYIAILEAAASFAITEMAEQRSRKLLEETLEMVKSKAIPEYQLFTTRSDLALRQQERIAAYELINTCKETMDKAVGGTNYFMAISNAFEKVILWANAVEINDVFSLQEALLARGDFNKMLDEINILDISRQQAREQEKSELNLNLTAIWQGEDPDNFFGGDKYLSYRNYGAEFSLVWSRRLGNRGEKARVKSLTALINEKMALLQDTEIKIRNELSGAYRNFSTAMAGMDLCVTATEEAKKALEAENERFRLGEGRSRNVLDSQKDLTEALKRQILIAIDLLKAYSSFNYYSGYRWEEETDYNDYKGE